MIGGRNQKLKAPQLSIVSLDGALLGFIIATAAIVLSVAPSELFTILRNNRYSGLLSNGAKTATKTATNACSLYPNDRKPS